MAFLNNQIPDLELQTGALSRVTGKGTHTTTTTIMYSVPEGGRLMDSPGVWEYGLWKMDQLDLAHGFIEFTPLLGHCKFNNCLHNSEPACAIREAVDAGEVSSWRYQSYLRLLEQAN
jgi:ribosome biogenesis GTPase